MTVREIAVGDLEGLLRLYTELHEDPMPAQGETLSALWHGILEDKNHHIVVAEKKGEIVSSCVVLVVPNLTHGQRPYALIENVVTAKAFRGRGLASACLDYAKQLALQHNCYKMMLLTGSRQESTLAFYRKAGYNSRDKTAFVQWL